MVSIIRIIGVTISFILVSFILGMLWHKLILREKDKCSITFVFVMGVMTMFATFQLVSVPLIIFRMSFCLLVYIWSGLIILLLTISLTINRGDMFKLVKDNMVELKSWKKESASTKAVFCASICMIALVTFLPTYYMCTDSDDARYVASALDMIDTDTMYQYHPLTGEYLGGPIGEMRKDVVAPYFAFVALICKVFYLHPAFFCHYLLPGLLVPFTFIVYFLLAQRLFSKERKYIYLFLFFLSILYLMGRCSAFWDSAYLLYRIWQGKAIFAVALLPLIIYLLIKIYDDINNLGSYVLLGITLLGTCLTTSMAAIQPLIIVGIYGVLISIYKKSINPLIYCAFCCVPNAIYGIVFYCIS